MRGRGKLGLWTRLPVAALCASLLLLLAGCLSLTNHNQSCRSSGDGFSCSGSVGTIKGNGPFTFDGDDDTDPDYDMEFTATVENGEMEVFADTASGGREGGTVSPGSPIRIQATVPSSDEEVSLDLEVKGGEDAEVRGMEYEATFTRVN